MDIISNALAEAQRKVLNMINNTGNRPNPDDTPMVLGIATNENRRPPPLLLGDGSRTTEGGTKPQAKLSKQANEFLDRMEERKKTMNLAIAAKNIKKKKRKAPDEATAFKTWNPREK